MIENKIDLKLVIALKMARNAISLSQQEVSSLTNISKTTIARFETLEGNIDSTQLIKLFKLYVSWGVNIDVLSSNGVTVTVSSDGLKRIHEWMQTDCLRRKDRGVKKKKLKVSAD